MCCRRTREFELLRYRRKGELAIAQDQHPIIEVGALILFRSALTRVGFLLGISSASPSDSVMVERSFAETAVGSRPTRRCPSVTARKPSGSSGSKRDLSMTVLPDSRISVR